MITFSSLAIKNLVFPSCLVMLLLATSLALALDEIEPNGTPATAQDLGKIQRLTTITGSLDAAGDADFFQLNSSNQLWGFIAVLDTSASTTDRDATLSVYDADGITLLQQDSGGWGKGSVLAWQHYQDRNIPIYIKVAASNAGSTISAYSLRIYVIAIGHIGETEPNDSWDTGNISSKSNLGSISNPTDVDCFRLSGNEDDKLILALRADPENDGSTTDFVLSLYDAAGSLLASADHSGPGGNEYIDTLPISHAIYSYCVTARSGTGSTASYKVGPLIDGYNYFPTYDLQPEWLNPGLGGVAIPGDILNFRLSVTNTTLLPIPPEITVGVSGLPTCLSFEDTSSFNTVSGDEAFRQFTAPLAPDATYQVDFSAKALSECNDKFHENVFFIYYDLGVGQDLPVNVTNNQCTTAIRQLAGPSYTGEGATYFSSETGIETAPATPFKITIGTPHKLILEAPWIRVRDGDELLVVSGAQLHVYGKSVSCPSL